jgi:hypothetical protein
MREKQRFENLEIACTRRTETKAEAMFEYLQKSGLEASTRVFLFDSPDDHVRAELTRRGWVENPVRTSGLFDLKWVATDTDEDYATLGPYDWINHFQNNRELTQKAGLLRCLRQLHVSEQSPIDSFFPRSYDLSEPTEVADFVLDFRRSAAVNILLKHAKLAGRPTYVPNRVLLKQALTAVNPFLWRNLEKSDKRKIFCPGRLFWVRLPLQTKAAQKKPSEQTSADAEAEKKISTNNRDWMLVPAVLLEAPLDLQIGIEQKQEQNTNTAPAAALAPTSKSTSRFSVLALVTEARMKFLMSLVKDGKNLLEKFLMSLAHELEATFFFQPK